MKRLLILFFCLTTHSIHADLKTAITAFENGYEYHLKAKQENDAKKKQVVLNLAKKLYATSAENFMKLRKRGATVPIAYLEFMRDKGLTSITDDIRWDETKLKRLEEDLKKEIGTEAYRDQNKSRPIPHIPETLINESKAALETSKLAIAAKITTDLNEKIVKIQELYKHYLASHSMNERALLHLHGLISPHPIDKMLENTSLGKEFRDYLLRIKNFDGSINIERKKFLFKYDSFFDPEFSLKSNRSKAFYPDSKKYNLFENSEDTAKFFTEKFAEEVARDRRVDYMLAMTAFQNGSAVINQKITLGRYEINSYNTLTPFAHHLNNDTDIMAYFTFLGYELFKCPACQTRLQTLSYLPTTYIPIDNDIDSKAPLECFREYKRNSKRNTDANNKKLLDKAVIGGVAEAILEQAKNYLRDPKNHSEIKKAVRMIKNLLNYTPLQKLNATKAEAKGLLAQAHLLYQIGDPNEGFKHATYCYENYHEITGEAPQGLLAYFLANGIGCRKNVKKALEIVSAEKIKSLWGALVELEQDLDNLVGFDLVDFHKKMGLINAAHAEEKTKTIFCPPNFFLHEKIYKILAKKYKNGIRTVGLTKNLDISLIELFTGFIYVVINSELTTYHERRNLVLLAEYLTFLPELYAKMSESLLKNRKETLKKPRYFLERALEFDIPEAHLLKARCMFMHKNGYDLDDREQTLEAAMVLSHKYKKYQTIDDKIIFKRITDELTELRHEARISSEINVTAEDLDEDDDFDDNAEIKAVTAPTPTTACPSTDHLRQAAESEKAPANEWTELVEEQRRLSKDKRLKEKEDLSLEHKISVPEDYMPAEEAQKAKIFTLSDKTYEFVMVIFGQGENGRIHNYDVRSTDEFLREIGCLNVDGTWTYQEDDGLVHKLCFHAGHSSGKESHKLHFGVRGIIKSFFIKIGLTPDTMEMKQR